MENIQNDIKKLHKLYALDDNYFILETYKYIEKLLKDYLKKDLDGNFNLYIEGAKLKLVEDDQTKKSHQLSVLNQLKVNHIKIHSYHINCSFRGIKPFDVLVNLYELGKIFHFRNTLNSIKQYFIQYSEEFEKIDKLYYKNLQPKFNKLDDSFQQMDIKKFDEAKLDDIKIHLKKIGGNINEFSQIINKEEFKNTSLKFDLTHLEYQKKYWALSDVQAKIVEKISSDLNGCFFIEGVAGSGKSMVLLKLFRMINDEDITATSYFLTFTNSLVRFDKNGLFNTNYRKDLIKKIKTIDGYFSFNWNLDFKDYKILRDQLPSNDNNILFELLESSIDIFNENGGDCKIPIDKAYNLIEHQIFERLYDRDDCQKAFSSLDLYFISEIYRSLQIEKKVVSKAFSIVCMINAIKSKGRKGYTDYILVDESQDLTLAQIELLRLSAKKALILAGDANQSIYLKESSLTDLPFSIKRFKLSENYRNTYEIKTLAASYLDSFKDSTSLKKVVYEKKATGLRPRLFKCSDVNSTIDLMIKKLKIDIDEFKLDLKDVLIICPSNYVIKQIVDKIELPIIYLKDREVDFNESSIKISTIYSSKGCGFAYIYLMIDNKIYLNTSFSREEKDIVLKRLIYVSLTRSMNSLNIFIPLSKFPLKPIYNLIELMD
jgi:hypothetical protein